MHKHVQRFCLLLSFLAIFTLLKAQDLLPPILPDCETIQLFSTDNQLTINGLTPPISLIKIYDDNFNLIFECNGDCEETLIIENLSTCQTYHVEGTFFYANYEEICSFQQDILINGQTDGATVCKGDVRLEDQAAVDAFCGCEIITGDLILGTNDNDITDISNLSGVQSVEGTFYVRGTKLTDLSALNIEKVFQGVDIEANPLLTSINIFNELERTNTISIRLNPQLKQINGFQNLKRVERLVIGGNENLVEITAFSALELVYSLTFSGNNAIKQLNSFPELATCTAQVVIRQNQALESMVFPQLKETAIVIIQDNPNLTTVGKFKYLNISFFLNIQENLALTDCCFLTNLVDDDFDNGYVGGTITVKDNGGMCSTIAEILKNCEGTPPTPCDDSVCQGDVVLNTQAEVDAFCGCEVIEGSLVIGAAPPNNALNDIISIQNLIALKQVKGDFTIIETQLTDLEGLNNLKEINGSAAFVGNEKLVSLKGLENLTTVDDHFSVLDNVELVDLNGLENLSKVNLQLQIQGNSSLTSISALSKIKKVELILIISNSSLKNLDGLEGLDSIFTSPESPVSGVLIAGNENLADISSLQNLKYVATDFTLAGNAVLEDCCSISHLIDDVLTNGQILGTINITDNPEFCNSVAAILAKCNDIPPVSCDNINITTGNNDLIIESITAPNSIVKIFDHDWQIAFECNGDCEATISLSDLTAGDIYHTDTQLYEENWQAICSDRQDIKILGGIPCDDSVCQGDVLLTTQAEVDAFCGCETIEGRLLIGLLIPNGVSDITSIANLHQLKSAKGGFSVVSTQLTSLEGLDNLVQADGGMGLVANSQLTSLKGLNKLKSVNNNLTLLDNPVLENLDALESLVEVNGQLSINTNDKLISIKGFSKITNATAIIIFDNENLPTLDGLENIATITSSSIQSGGLTVAGNSSLEDISSLQGVKLIEGRFNLSGNTILEDCCAITHLIDEADTNGQVLGDVTITVNPAFCSSVEEILAKCGVPSSCDNIDISYANNELKITGLTAPRAIVKVFDEDWQQIFDCFNDCEEPITLSNLSGNTFHIRIANYDEDWKFLCHGDQDITITGSRNINDLLPKDFTLSPNLAYEETTIDLNRLLGETVDLKMYNQFGQEVFERHIEKVGTSSEKIDLSMIANGFYLLKIQAKGKRPIAKKIMVSRLY